MDMEVDYQESKRLHDLLRGRLAEDCDKTLEELDAAMMPTDHFMSPDEAKEFGLIDEVLAYPDAAKELSEASSRGPVRCGVRALFVSRSSEARVPGRSTEDPPPTRSRASSIQTATSVPGDTCWLQGCGAGFEAATMQRQT